MKPVNLLPGNAPAAVAVAGSAGKPNLGLIGGAAAGVVALVFVAGFFAMARVDSVKSETAKLLADAAQADSQTQATRSTIETLGKPVVDSDKQLAQGAEQVLVSAYAERHDFVLLSRELRSIMDGTGGWYVRVNVSAAGSSLGQSASELGDKTVRIEGYMPTKELAAGFNERVNGTRTLKDGTTVSLKSERLVGTKSKKASVYWHFVLTADIVDTDGPDSGSTGSSSVGTGVVDGSTVAGTTASAELTLSLDPEPVKAKPKAPAKAAAAPTNPFGLAANAAAGGGAK